MSLLMQALKKAERNKLDALPDEDDIALPSESYDHVLALTPDDVLSGRVPPAPSAFSLEPMEDPGRATEPAGSVSEQVPALEPAIPAPHDPTPPQSRRHTDHASAAQGLHYEPALPAVTAIDEALAWTAGEAPKPPMPVLELALEEVPPTMAAQDMESALATAPIAPVLDFEESWSAPAAPHPAAGPDRAAHGAYAGADAASGPPDGGAQPAAGNATGGKSARHGPRHAAHPERGSPSRFAGAPAGTGEPAGAGSGAADTAGRGAGRGTGTGAGTATGAGAGSGTGTGAGASAAAGAGMGIGAAAGTGTAAASAPSGLPGNSRGTAARARAAAQAAAEQDQPRRDPARVRLAVLGAVLALVAGTLAGVYWYALTAPGPGASLPPVPMPPPGARTGPAPIAVVPPAAGPYESDPGPPANEMQDGTVAAPPQLGNAGNAGNAGNSRNPGYAGLPQAHSATPAPPHSGSRMPSDDDLQHALQQQAPATPHGEPAPAAYGAPTSPAPNPQTAANTANAANPASASAAAPAADIHVARSTVPPRVNAALQDGYQSFMAGDYTTAAQYYALALRQDPNNRDALLGNAAIAARRNDINAATSGYQRLLELNPADPDAQAGLLALRPGDLGNSERRLKELLRREPGAGPLEFALGNLYAQQGRWPDAQQAYFRAYSAVPDNADYAFNLAVGLDRLSQRKLALTYYQRALDLSRTSPAAFDRTAARRRAEQLAGRVGGPAAQLPDSAAVPATASTAGTAAPAVPAAADVQPVPPDNATSNGRQP